MSKRATLDLRLKKDDRTDDPDLNLRKKIKIEHDFIISRAKRVNEELDLTDHEVNKFLIIFHTLLDTIDLESEPEETDGIITDIILQIVLKISSLLRQNFGVLPIPQILKDALKLIKQLFNAKKQSSERPPMDEKEFNKRPSSPSSSSSSSASSTSSSNSSATTAASSTPATSESTTSAAAT